MSEGLTRSGVGSLLHDLREGLPGTACCTCDCFQGFLTQLELDAVEGVADLTTPLKVLASQMHGCLGCDPCPPGSAFAAYLRGLAQPSRLRTCCEPDCDCRKEQ